MRLLVSSQFADRSPSRHSLLAAAVMACLIVSQTGCSVWRQARRTLITEPAAFSWKWDRSRSLKTYRRWADEAWQAERGGCPDGAGDADYALGFRDGFVDYIYAGGNAEPPPVPPREYWNVAMRGPDGKAAAAQWFAGYRHGANVARAGGLREHGVVASSYAWGGAMAEDYAPQGPPIEELQPADELLPEPLETGAGDDLIGDDLIEESSDEAPSAAPELMLPESTPIDPDLPSDAEPVADEPAAVEPAPVEPELDLPTRAASRRPSTKSKSAVERFRHAVSTVQHVEPRATK
jgi:hypothetical protein